MVSKTSIKFMAAPSVFALLAAATLGLSASPASAALSPNLSAPTPAMTAHAAPEKALQVAGTKKKKKKRRKKRRGSYSS